MIYELRIYDILPGRMAAINNRFAHTTSRFFAKHGIRVVGYWEDLVGTSNRLTYLVAYESLAHREQVWDAFASDPEWLAARDKSEEDGQIVARIHNTLLRPTPYVCPSSHATRGTIDVNPSGEREINCGRRCFLGTRP